MNLGIYTDVFLRVNLPRYSYDHANKFFYNRALYFAGAGDFNCRNNFTVDNITPPIRAVKFLVGVTGIEPATPCTPCKYSTRLSYTPNADKYNPFFCKKQSFYSL